MADYPPPVDRLLSIEPGSYDRPWPDYLALGLGPQHVPDLIRMATDPVLLYGVPGSQEGGEADGDDLSVWAPVHAWRALGQLRAEEAIGPLLDVLAEAEDRDNDSALEDLPVVFGQIGPAAMPGLTAVLADPSRGQWTRTSASTALVSMAMEHPEVRAECVALIAGQLAAFPDNEVEFNAFLVGDLAELKAVEAAPLIERAFEAGAVEESICGDWPWIRFELGLGEEPPPRRYDHGFGNPFAARSLASPAGSARARPVDRKQRNKARRKLEKRARKQNRKKRR